MLSVIVVAAGRGVRMGAECNKLLLPLCGEPVLCRTLQRLERCNGIDELILVAQRDEIAVWHEMELTRRFPKLQHVVAGGESRAASVLAGLAVVDLRTEWVAVHDGARPLLKAEDFAKLLACREVARAALLAVPVKETVKRGGLLVQATLPRGELWQAQTPQLFERDLLEKAYAAIQGREYQFTDDASIVEALGASVLLVAGDYSNLKITTPEDLVLAEAIWRWQEDANRERL